MDPIVKEVLEQCRDSMEWMITDLKWRRDQTECAPEHYSPKLREAIETYNKVRALLK